MRFTKWWATTISTASPGTPVDINAQMAALEVSYDRDWIRYKASVFYASGDDKPTDGTAHGFDSIRGQSEFHRRPVQLYGCSRDSISRARRLV